MSSAKETSDALNPPMVEAARVVVPARCRSAGDYIALALATCGVGLIPLAPGTWGSAVGVLVYLALGRGAQTTFDYVVTRGLDLSPQTFQTLLTTTLLLVVFVISLAGTWAATRAEKLFGKKDPGAVVVDEVAGEVGGFLFVPGGGGGGGGGRGLPPVPACAVEETGPVPPPSGLGCRLR